jgi:hypothetical protein
MFILRLRSAAIADSDIVGSGAVVLLANYNKTPSRIKLFCDGILVYNPFLCRREVRSTLLEHTKSCAEIL